VLDKLKVLGMGDGSRKRGGQREEIMDEIQELTDLGHCA